MNFLGSKSEPISVRFLFSTVIKLNLNFQLDVESFTLNLSCNFEISN